MAPSPKKAALGLLALGLAAGPACAQSQPDTVRLASLEAAVAAAVQHNPTQAVYQQQLRQAAYTYRAAKGALYPQVAGTFAGTDNLHLPVTPVPGELVGKPGTTFYAQFGRPYTYNAGLTASQSLFDWPRVLQAQVARGNLALAQVQQAAYAQSLREQVAQLYYAALIAKAALRINQLDFQLADTLQTLARQRLQEGTGDRLAANQAAISYQQVRQRQAQSQQLLDQSLGNLKILLGAAPASTLLLAGELPLAAPPPALGPDLPADKTLAVSEQQAQLATLQSLAQRAAAYPLVSLNGYFGAQQFRDDFGFSLNQSTWSGYRYVALNVSVPLFTGLANQYKYKSAEVARDIARLQADNARRESATTDQLLRQNYADYLALASSAAASFQLYADNVQLTRQKYREGLLAVDSYLRVFQDYLTAENTYLNSLAQLYATRATFFARQ